MRQQRVTILNGGFDPLTHAETVDAVFGAIDAGRPGWLCTVNVSTLMMMRKDPGLQSFVDSASLVVADGQPLVWCAPLFGGRIPERVTGIDLIGSLCQRALAEGKGVYLLGATDGVLSKALGRLRARYPGLRIDGANGYFSPEDGAERAEAIRASGASLLLVGMGSPRQEAFIRDHWEKLPAGIAIGVGGSFDVIAGTRVRAHPWIGRAGMEWLVRLMQEPRRLAGRYVTTNSTFCVLLASAVVSRFKR